MNEMERLKLEGELNRAWHALGVANLRVGRARIALAEAIDERERWKYEVQQTTDALFEGAS